MHPASHPRYAALDPEHRQVVDALCGGGPPCQSLPFGSDRAYDEVLIVAAEADANGKQILVVCASDWDSEVLEARWKQKGSEAVERNGSPDAFSYPVRVIDLENLAWYEDEHRDQHYAVCLLVGLDDDKASYVYQAVRAARYWRAVFSDGSCDSSWPLGPAGQLLDLSIVFEQPLQRGPRSRPSALAERLTLPV